MAARLPTTSTGYVDNIPDPTAGGASSTAPRCTEKEFCDPASCYDMKLVSMVPQQKKAQFVIEPKIKEKPLLVNGLTTVFQVDGRAAKLSDLKNPDSTADNEPKTIFRVVPNTHTHIVNYVVVDSVSETLRKIQENDPATMNIMLESQKAAVDEMLRKKMAGHNSSVHVANVPVTSTGQSMQSDSPANTPVNATLSENMIAVVNRDAVDSQTQAGLPALTDRTRSCVRTVPIANLQGLAMEAATTVAENMTDVANRDAVDSQTQAGLPAPTHQTRSCVRTVPIANLQGVAMEAATTVAENMTAVANRDAADSQTQAGLPAPTHRTRSCVRTVPIPNLQGLTMEAATTVAENMTAVASRDAVDSQTQAGLPTPTRRTRSCVKPVPTANLQGLTMEAATTVAENMTAVANRDAVDSQTQAGLPAPTRRTRSCVKTVPRANLQGLTMEATTTVAENMTTVANRDAVDSQTQAGLPAPKRRTRSCVKTVPIPNLQGLTMEAATTVAENMTAVASRGAVDSQTQAGLPTPTHRTRSCVVLEPTTATDKTQIEEMQKKLNELQKSLDMVTEAFAKIQEEQRMQSMPSSTGGTRRRARGRGRRK